MIGLGLGDTNVLMGPEGKSAGKDFIILFKEHRKNASYFLSLVKFGYDAQSNWIKTPWSYTTFDCLSQLKMGFSPT